jgi:hypothetical protein
MFALTEPAKHLHLAALGARLCYTPNPVENLFSDPKVVNPEKRLGFLDRLITREHYSVFAPVPMVFKLTSRELPSFILEWVDTLVANGVPKVHYANNGGVVILTLRHLIESIYNRRWGTFISEELRRDLKNYWSVIKDLSLLNLNSKLFADVKEEKLGNLTAYLLHNSPRWAVVLIDGLSRVATHQLVRHCACNFLQRSHRYTEAQNVNLPASIGWFDKVRLFIQQAFTLYHTLLQDEVKKEDARYVLPCGVTSPILIAGPKDWCFEPLLYYRLKKKGAQTEIRTAATLIDRLLSGATI